jgi:hypothetical protein
MKFEDEDLGDIDEFNDFFSKELDLNTDLQLPEGVDINAFLGMNS